MISILTSTLLLFLLLFGEIAVSDPMACEPNGECSDPCVYFGKGIVFNADGTDGALLQYKSKIILLKKKSEKILKLIDKDAELPGHTVEQIYDGDNIRVALVSEISSETCFFKNELGKWQSTEKGCQGSSKMKLKIVESGKAKVYKTTWNWGC